MIGRLLCWLGWHRLGDQPVDEPGSFDVWVRSDQEQPCLRSCGYVAKWLWTWSDSRWERTQ